MRRRRLVWCVGLALLSALASRESTASTVMQLNLDQMVGRAGNIYRGTVLSATSSTVAAGGGQLPVTIYRLRVDESFRGEFQEVKGVRIAELRTLGKLSPVVSGNLRSAVVLPRSPELVVGESYLVLATRPSAIGLSATVGLGQGCFKIFGVGKAEMAVNETNNQGLLEGTRRTRGGSTAPSGPIAYSDIANRIRGLVAR
jgi:hypothetical protein